jgi:sec-independent protein translocase protein TatC
MTFGEHLEELRGRLMKGVLAFAVAFAAAFAFQDRLLHFFQRPYESARRSVNAELLVKFKERPPAEWERALSKLLERLEEKSLLTATEIAPVRELVERETREAAPQLGPLQAIGMLEGFNSYMLVCLIAAAVVSAPVLLWQLWRFVAEGLYSDERRLVLKVLPVSLGLFFVGVGFGYGVMAEMSVRFLIGYGDIEMLRPQVSIGSYLGILLLLLVVMGLTFQIPLIMTVLAATGLVGPDFYRSKRRHCILAIVVIAAIITPPDYLSQLLVAGPMWLLFEIGIWLAAAASRRRAVRGADA